MHDANTFSLTLKWKGFTHTSKMEGFPQDYSLLISFQKMIWSCGEIFYGG